MIITYLNLFALTTLRLSSALKAYKFYNKGSEQNLTYLSLENPPVLPDIFIICSSHRQTKVDSYDTHGIYTIYENDNLNPWFSIAFWRNNVLWINVGYQYFYKLSDPNPLEMFLSWIHICVEVDSKAKTVSTMINGKVAFRNVSAPGLSQLPKLNLVFGIVDETYYNQIRQFDGTIGRIDFLLPDEKTGFHTNNLDLCHRPSNVTFLSWTAMEWNKVGNNVDEEFVTQNDLCLNDTKVFFRTDMKACELGLRFFLLCKNCRFSICKTAL